MNNLPVKSVILNADDFGACSRVNAAVVRAHTEGVLTSASLMVNEPYCAEAVLLARSLPELGVGIHVVLSDGLSALSGPALTGKGGAFSVGPALAGLRCFFQPAARRQARAEIRAQFDRFGETGLHCTHADGHQHLHVHPVIWDALIGECAARGVRWVRVPNEEFLPASPGRMVARRTEWLWFRVLGARCRRTARRVGIRVADRVYGHLESGRITEMYLLNLLDRLGGGTNEVYFHPGARAEGDGNELAALTSRAVRERIDSLGIRRTSFADA